MKRIEPENNPIFSDIWKKVYQTNLSANFSRGSELAHKIAMERADEAVRRYHALISTGGIYATVFHYNDEEKK